jgi:hypothetical protein
MAEGCHVVTHYSLSRRHKFQKSASKWNTTPSALPDPGLSQGKTLLLSHVWGTCWLLRNHGMYHHELTLTVVPVFCGPLQRLVEMIEIYPQLLSSPPRIENHDIYLHVVRTFILVHHGRTGAWRGDIEYFPTTSVTFPFFKRRSIQKAIKWMWQFIRPKTKLAFHVSGFLLEKLEQ